MAAIELDDVSLHFCLNTNRLPLKERFIELLRRRPTSSKQFVKAINNIDLQIVEGERVGIIGHNGAGKSTFLRMLTGVYRPTGGKLTVDGRLDSLLDLNVGVEAEASGWENISYRGYLRGETPRQVAVKRPEIAEFSELGDRLHTPVRFYSSGMMVRLLFSMATAIEPEILLIDEVLSAGDIAFYEKARKRMTNLIEKARILVVVSHDLGSLATMCTRVLWFDHGRIVADGDPQEIIDRYKTAMMTDLKIAA